MAARKKSQDFESALTELEQLIEKLETGDLSLEESLKVFENGIKLTRDCQKTLADAEQKVQQLIASQGELQLQEFPTDE
ncbi:exodeoxyribonuclease VII small subunit [Marinibactrum halimedae]|uniref:Exodeoxyribonuclease 7 small subunit n=1 Tax=Marinibactrum halimedae TaxID=1444977 RepID=A0AA37WNQ4_9GAMM|nr:exodeoxyribonuclease VII small subunit [Marinibactrum halimedae]MCD9461016.1 exodeoxyribonuclease VII small subunit [Marinibactrum halimedae]GLS27798.1 exodeoxyribonuclease 7 small subunit [Marinibactrum halimedae]